MSDASENEEIDSKSVKVDFWRAEMKKRINESKIYDVTLTPPDDGSVDINKFIEFQKTLENYLNYQPIKWDITLIDNFLKLYSPEDTLEKFKSYLEAQEGEKANDLSKKENVVSNMDKTKKFYRDTKKRSRRSRYSKNLLSVTQIIKKNDSREAFFRITKLTKTDLCDKDISSIIEEFMKIRLALNPIKIS
ncbi:16703_t:CDS:1 [Gigaspora margarita]|uniref:16703_t:CDS:1 n=1 Tax=Gigaspora margarita TaxID=4874 RepID=A0ABN7W7U9_GIGMA|nr:16703_t:CDS:1 [Gigaspora margarita]